MVCTCDENGVIVVDFGFTMLLTSQVISFAFYSEREKSAKFCSKSIMFIPEFGNALLHFGHNTTQIVGPEGRKNNYKRKIMS